MSSYAPTVGREISFIEWGKNPGFLLDGLFLPLVGKRLNRLFGPLPSQVEEVLKGAEDKKDRETYELSSGTNFLFPPTTILNALGQDTLNHRYLSSYSGPIGLTMLRAAIFLYEEAIKGSPLSDVEVAVTAGGAEALALACHYIKSLKIAKRVLLAGPQHPIVFQSMVSSGLTFQELLSSQRQSFLPTPHEIEEALRMTDAHVLFLTEPNNPSGEQHSLEEFAAILATLKQHGVYLILDKVCSDASFHPFIQTLNYGKVLDEYDYWDHTCIIDSLSKRRAVSGLRFGYLIGPPSLIKFVYEQRIGGCPPNIAVEGIMRDLLYSAYVSQRKQDILVGQNNDTFTCLADRLHELTYGVYRQEGMNLGSVVDIEQYIVEVQAMYHTIYENLQTCMQRLAPWIIAQTTLSAGFNYLVCFAVPENLTENFSFSTRIFAEVGVSTYPLFCFFIDPQVAINKMAPGKIWVRISMAEDRKTFIACIERVRDFLQQHSK